MIQSSPIFSTLGPSVNCCVNGWDTLRHGPTGLSPKATRKIHFRSRVVFQHQHVAVAVPHNRAIDHAKARDQRTSFVGANVLESRTSSCSTFADCCRAARAGRKPTWNRRRPANDELPVGLIVKQFRRPNVDRRRFVRHHRNETLLGPMHEVRSNAHSQNLGRSSSQLSRRGETCRLGPRRRLGSRINRLGPTRGLRKKPGILRH